MKRRTQSLIAVAAAMGLGSAAHANLIITEIWAGVTGPDHSADWFEVTNIGAETTDLSGVFYDDESADPTENSSLAGVSSIAAGESVIFLTSWEDDFASAMDATDSFAAAWGLDSSVQVGL